MSERLTGNLVIQLILCVAVSFLGICLVYFADIIVTFLLEKTKAKRIITGQTYIVSAVLGAIVLAFTVYYGIYSSQTVAVFIGIVCGGSGLAVQCKNEKRRVQFKTYDDLLKLKPLKEGED